MTTDPAPCPTCTVTADTAAAAARAAQILADEVAHGHEGPYGPTPELPADAPGSAAEAAS